MSTGKGKAKSVAAAAATPDATDIHVKIIIKWQDSIRRFALPSLSLPILLKLVRRCNVDPETPVDLTYLDSEGDWVLIEREEDIQLALEDHKGDRALRIAVDRADEDEGADDDDDSSEEDEPSQSFISRVGSALTGSTANLPQHSKKEPSRDPYGPPAYNYRRARAKPTWKVLQSQEATML